MLRIVALSLAVLAASSGASARSRIDITPLLVDFGRLDIGTTTELPGALTIRVYSSEPWTLMIAPGHSSVTGDGVNIPISRIEYRGGRASTYTPLSGSAELIRGGPTTEAGTLIQIDLRFSPQEDDGAGRFNADIEFLLLPQSG